MPPAEHLQPATIHALKNGSDLMAEQQATGYPMKLQRRCDGQALIQLKRDLFTSPELIKTLTKSRTAGSPRRTERVNLQCGNPDT